MVEGERLEFPVKKNSLTIGRSPKCDIVIVHDGISRQHCLLEVESTALYVTDLGSTNGVMIDGVKIPPNQRTEFKTFLPLSFGPVQSLMVDLEEEVTDLTRTTSPNLSAPSGRSEPTKVQRPAATEGRQRRPPPPSRKKGVNASTLMMNLIALLILALGVYWFMNKDSFVEYDLKPGKAKEKEKGFDFY
jgi:predicted component of type VI protein secretion system